jgi:hypothetical protein
MATNGLRFHYKVQFGLSAIVSAKMNDKPKHAYQQNA